MPEIWTSPEGCSHELRYVGRVDEEWYPEGPGQRPPARYNMVATGWNAGEITTSFTVFPVEPWSPYDAAYDLLVSEGWIPPPPTAEELETCEHGLAASLCHGPMHY